MFLINTNHLSYLITSAKIMSNARIRLRFSFIQEYMTHCLLAVNSSVQVINIYKEHSQNLPIVDSL